MLRSAEVQPVFQDLCIQCASACWMTILPSPFLPFNKIPPSSACLCSPHNGETTRQATPCNSTTWTCTEKVLVRVVVLFPSRAQRSGRNIFIRQSTYHNPIRVISPLAIFYKAFREHHSDMLPGMVEVLYLLQAQDGPTVRNSNGQDFFLGASPCTLCVGRALASETAGRNFFMGPHPTWCAGMGSGVWERTLVPPTTGRNFFTKSQHAECVGMGSSVPKPTLVTKTAGRNFFMEPQHTECVGRDSGMSEWALATKTAGRNFFTKSQTVPRQYGSLGVYWI